MANTFFKPLTESDRTSSRTLLHEAIPITGTLVSGTYVDQAVTLWDNTVTKRGENVKTFSHGMFQSVYDYPYASSSANHIFDITVGVAPYVPTGSVMVAGEAGNPFQGNYTEKYQLYNQVVSGSGEGIAKKKRAIYNQMAQVLVGYDTEGKTRLFDADGDFSTKTDKILDPIFISFSRLLTKDEIKKGSFSMDLGVSASFGYPFGKQINVADTGADTNYKVNSPAGEYGILKVTNKVGTPLSAAAIAASGSSCGLIYYQAGVVVLDGSKVFRQYRHPSGSAPAGFHELMDHDGLLDVTGSGGTLGHTTYGATTMFSGSHTMTLAGPNLPLTPDKILLSGSIDLYADNVRQRIQNISFNNTTELNSTIYFCRANHNEFNYSSNVTYLTGSQIRVKAGEVLNPPKSYVTTVGMYSADNELLAVAKLSEPLRKDPTNELTLRVRLDY
jgi:hypothetical protein